MSSLAVPALLTAACLILACLVAFLVYCVAKYTPIIGRIFEEKPVFLPLRMPAEPGGEDVRFRTADGLELAGTYYRAATRARAGVVVFCHEFLSDRRSFSPYAGPLRDLGFDVFTFDFRNHGESDADPSYQPLQWPTNHEVRDLRAALAYLRSRPDRDPAGFGLFGISRGGGAALCVASKDPGVWGVVTDGAFPTRGTMAAYIDRWAEIYIGSELIWQKMPRRLYGWLIALVGWSGRIRSERRLGCRFPNIERAVARLAPRPWLMIHGEKDTYIGPEIARRLFALAGEPKESWIVPRAKHNRCREMEPEAYRARVEGFVHQFAPRRLSPAVAQASPKPPRQTDLAPSRSLDVSSPEPTAPLSGSMATPIPG